MLEFQELNRDNREMGYTKRAVSGFSWNTIVTIATAAVTALKLYFLARLLDQRDFGLFALVSIALGLTDSVTQTGVNITIIQAKESIKYFVNTAWVIAIIRGLVIGLLMLALGFGMAKFYSEQSLVLLVAFAAFVPVIKGFINPSIITMQKELRFFRDSVYKFSLVLVEAVFAVLLGWYLHSVYALIFSIIGAAVFEVIISFIFFKVKPVFEYIPNRAKLIFKESKGLSFSSALSYLSENIDEVILGRTVGTNILGVYHTGYSLSHRPTVGVAQSLNASTFPVFSKINADKQRLRRAFIKSTLGLTTILIVALIPLTFFAEPVVTLVLGDKWLSVIPVLPWLAVAGAAQALTITAYNLLINVRAYKVMNWHRAVSIIVFIPILYFASVKYGVLGAGMAWVTTRMLGLPVIFYAAFRKLK